MLLFFLTDVDDVKFVINFDYPNNSEDYIHRIGRTGRSSQKGTSYAFFTHSNSKQAKDLVAVLTEANQRVDPKLAAMAARSYRMLLHSSIFSFNYFYVYLLLFFYFSEWW